MLNHEDLVLGEQIGRVSVPQRASSQPRGPQQLCSALPCSFSPVFHCTHHTMALSATPIPSTLTLSMYREGTPWISVPQAACSEEWSLPQTQRARLSVNLTSCHPL